MIAAAGAWTQDLPYTPGTTTRIWTSPQSSTTEGRYRSNADDFIRPDSYTNLKFDKWFGLTAFRWDETTNFSAIATTGFATKINTLFISAFYSGNFWTGAPVNNYAEQEPSTTPAGGTSGKVYNIYNNINMGGANNPVNNVALLLGFADMGIRLTYRTDYQSFKKSNIVTENQLYKNYFVEKGYIAPQVAWAMAKNLTANGIKPYVTVDLNFNRDYRRTETEGPDVAGGTNATGKSIVRSQNYFEPMLSVGLGGFTLLNKEGFRLSTDLDYVLTLNIYDNEYSYIDNGEYKTGKIKGTYSPGSNPYIERSYISNLFTPSLSGQWSKEKLALRFKLNLPLTFISDEQNSMAQDTSGKLVYNGTSNSYSTFRFRPDLRLAFQYKIIPDRLTLNAGARIQSTSITLGTLTESHYSMGTKTATRKVKQDATAANDGSGSSFVSRFHIGPTFSFTENFWVEATTGVSNAYGDGAIDVFGSGGLFTFGSIMVGLKF
jgi:hypothetical protein